MFSTHIQVADTIRMASITGMQASSSRVSYARIADQQLPMWPYQVCCERNNGTLHDNFCCCSSGVQDCTTRWVRQSCCQHTMLRGRQQHQGKVSPAKCSLRPVHTPRFDLQQQQPHPTTQTQSVHSLNFTDSKHATCSGHGHLFVSLLLSLEPRFGVRINHTVCWTSCSGYQTSWDCCRRASTCTGTDGFQLLHGPSCVELLKRFPHIHLPLLLLLLPASTAQ